VAGPSWDSREAAELWRQGAASRREGWWPTFELALDRLDLRPGMRVLDLGAGTGDQTIPIARLVGPEGSVLAADVSAAMLAVLAEEAAAAGLGNVATVVGDACDLDLAPRSFDGAVSFNCIQFIRSPVAALRLVQAALKPGARLAAMVFGPAERSYAGRIQEAIRRAGALPPPDPDEPGMFALGAPGRCERVLRAAGFQAVDVQEVEFPRTFASRDEYLRTLDTPNYRHLLDQLDPERRAAAVAAAAALVEEMALPDGRIRGTSTSLLAVATA
jgi:SAM-dependent methyltransferase